MPMVVATAPPRSSWSAASISASSLMVSTGAPLRRSGSAFSPPSPPVVCASSVRERVSGLYWKATTLGCGLGRSKVTSAPLSSRGEFGNEDIGHVLSVQVQSLRWTGQGSASERVNRVLGCLSFRAPRLLVGAHLFERRGLRLVLDSTRA